MGQKICIVNCHCTYFEGYKVPLLFHFENASITLSNLKFISSHILGSNVNMEIRNCQFDNAALFLMETRRYIYYFDQTILYLLDSQSELLIGYVYWTPWADKHWGKDKYQFLPATCFSIFAALYNVEWLPQKNEAPQAIDTPHPLRITVNVSGYKYQNKI